MQNMTAFFQKNKKSVLTVLGLVVVLVLVKQIFFKPAVISVVGTASMTAKPARVEMLVTKVDSNPDPVLAIAAGENGVKNRKLQILHPK